MTVGRLSRAWWWARNWARWVRYTVRGFFEEFLSHWWALRPGALSLEQMQEKIRRHEEAVGLRPPRPRPPALPGDAWQWH